MGRSIQSCTHVSLQRSVFCLCCERCGSHSRGISIDHEGLLLLYPGAVNRRMIPQLWQKWDGSWMAKRSCKLSNGPNQYSWLCDESLHVQVLWMGCKPSSNQCVSIKVSPLKLGLLISAWMSVLIPLLLQHSSVEVVQTLHLIVQWNWVTMKLLNSTQPLSVGAQKAE